MLMRTDPFRDLDRLAQQVLGTTTRPAAMPIDAHRRDDEFVVELDLPGVERDSIDITVERNVLSVHAQRRRSEGEDVELLMSERPHGTFSRQLLLGDALDSEHIDAAYVDGVLTLRLKIAERAKPRRVPISRTESQAPTIEATASTDRSGPAEDERALAGSAS